MTKAYSVFAGVVLAALAWVHFTGWSPSNVTEERGVSPNRFATTRGRTARPTGGRREIVDDKNMALAIVVGAVAIGI